MEALKWIGSILAATIVLAVAVGIGILLSAVAAIGGALVFTVSLVLMFAALIKSL